MSTRTKRRGLALQFGIFCELPILRGPSFLSHPRPALTGRERYGYLAFHVPDLVGSSQIESVRPQAVAAERLSWRLPRRESGASP
jgi:hypothetical protein